MIFVVRIHIDLYFSDIVPLAKNLFTIHYYLLLSKNPIEQEKVKSEKLIVKKSKNPRIKRYEDFWKGSTNPNPFDFLAYVFEPLHIFENYILISVLKKCS